MTMGGKLISRFAPIYLGDQNLRCPSVYSWYGIQELNLI
jgi:hypothetical protein